MLKYLISLLLLNGAFLCPAAAQVQGSERVFRVGPSDITPLSPEKVVQDYQSNLFPDQRITVKYRGTANSLRILRGGVAVPISDQVFLDLIGKLRWFVLEDFQIFLGSDERPIRCLQLSFDVVENEIVSGGSIEMCDGRPVRIRLQGIKSNAVDNIIYDSSISKEYIPDGVWEEVQD